MTDGKEEFLPTEKRCERCGVRGYYIEDGQASFLLLIRKRQKLRGYCIENELCLNCMEVELRKNTDLILQVSNWNNHLKGRLNRG